LLVVNGSPSMTSRTAALARAAADLGDGDVLHLAGLPAEGLLGRRKDRRVSAALDAVRAADRLVLATPVYRATYSGLLKLLLDALGDKELAGRAVLLAATGGTDRHFLSLDTGLRAAVATLSAWVVPTVVYAVGSDFVDGRPGPAIAERLRQGLAETRLIRAVHAADGDAVVPGEAGAFVQIG
jgi:FMN reductase